jgi:ferredoxin
VAPDVYVLDDEGYNRTAEKVVGAEHRASAIRGKRACPERIISVEDIP